MLQNIISQFANILTFQDFYSAIVFYLIIFVCLHLIFCKKDQVSLKGKHVVITGGSSGIGKSLAILVVKRGAHVTIIARTAKKLIQACEEIKQYIVSKEQEIAYSCCSVSDKIRIDQEIETIDQKRPIFMFVNCAGLALCNIFDEATHVEIDNLINTNIYGTILPLHHVIKLMKPRKEGILVLIGSQASLLGIYGLSVYSCTKFAIRGLAESLHMELRDFNISVTLCVPPDTDTPGLELENQNKPDETKLISGSAGLFASDDIAHTLLEDALNGKFFSYAGFESWILTTLCVGMTPHNNILELLLQFMLLGGLRIISMCYLKSFHNTITKCYKRKYCT